MGNETSSRIRRGVLAFCAIWCVTAGAQAATKFTPIHCNEEGGAEAASLHAAESALKLKKPAHLVILIHGFNVTENASNGMFNTVAERIRTAFAPSKKRVEIVGIQWPSATGGDTRWIKKSVRHKLFGVGQDPYLKKAELALAVGRQGLRQVVVRLAAALPNTRIHLFAHSLGAVVALSSLTPDVAHKAARQIPFFDADQSVDYDLLCLCGADLNQDQTKTGKFTGGSAQMLWITTAFLKTKQDEALLARIGVRKSRAIGNAAPRLRTDQIDAAVRNCSLVFDNEGIPRDHLFVHYYTPERVQELVRAILTIQDHKHPKSPLIAQLMKILTAPATVEALTPYLQEKAPTVVYYALWRLEHLVCGSAAHLADDSLRRALSSSMKDPDRFAREKAKYACKLIQKGIWPPLAPAAFPEESVDASGF